MTSPKSFTSVYGHTTTNPKLIEFHQARHKPIKAICIKDNPPSTSVEHHVFKKGDIVDVKGLVGTMYGKFEVCIPSPTLGFYDVDYFEVLSEFELEVHKICESNT